MEDWTSTSLKAALEGAMYFAEIVMAEHEWPCHCRRCAEASWVITALRNFLTAPEDQK